MVLLASQQERPLSFSLNVRTHYILKNWNEQKVQSILGNYGIPSKRRPDFSNLTFVQIDEFYPMESTQHTTASIIMWQNII